MLNLCDRAVCDIALFLSKKGRSDHAAVRLYDVLRCCVYKKQWYTIPWSTICRKAPVLDELLCKQRASVFFFYFFRAVKALVVDALADKRLYEQELARMRRDNAFLEDQASTDCG